MSTAPASGSENTLTRGTSPDEIAHVIRNAIATGVYPPGTPLSQVELAARFDVSRIPLREAMRTLISEGLLVQQPGRSIEVRNLDLNRITEVYDLRILIEPSFAAEVVRNCSRADVEALTAMVQLMEEIGASDPDRWSQVHFQFHLALYRLARLPIHFEMISQLYHLVEPYSRLYVHQYGGRARAESEHRSMLEHLDSGDVKLLERVILEHVNAGRDTLAAQHEHE